jgi:hypothetical protein
MQVKLREIVHCKKQIVYGVTIPQEYAIFFHGCFFTIERSGNAIILTSGASLTPTQEQIKNYRFGN